MRKRIPVGVLAATGSVGQRFVQLLDNHPWFEVAALSGSEKRVGQSYGETCHWMLTEPMPEWAREMKITPTTPEAVDAPLVFSALPSEAAKTVELQFAQAGVFICSNASSYRQEADVPILFPEVNADHTALVAVQQAERGWKGAIVTNSNCTSTGLTISLKPLLDNFGLRQAVVVSLQALSGAGHPGVASMDIMDNVIPYIQGEEEKVEWEPRKMLGTVNGGKLELADFVISAHTNRVAVTDGHMVCVSVAFEKDAELQDVADAFRSYKAPEISRDLPSAPDPVIILRDEADRPQPRLDRMSGKGMATVIGRLRPDPVLNMKYIVYSHNTIRGAAGGSIFNAELLVKKGLVSAN